MYVANFLSYLQLHREARVGTKDSDGTFQGRQYFTCDDGCGLFVTLEKLCPITGTQQVATKAHEDESGCPSSHCDTRSETAYTYPNRDESSEHDDVSITTPKEQVQTEGVFHYASHSKKNRAGTDYENVGQRHCNRRRTSIEGVEGDHGSSPIRPTPQQKHYRVTGEQHDYEEVKIDYVNPNPPALPPRLASLSKDSTISGGNAGGNSPPTSPLIQRRHLANDFPPETLTLTTDQPLASNDSSQDPNSKDTLLITVRVICERSEPN